MTVHKPAAYDIKSALDRFLVAFNAGHHGEASGIVDDIDTNAPNHPNALRARAFVLAQRKDLEGAVALQERAVAATNDPLWRTELASWLRIMGRFDHALHHAKMGIPIEFGRSSKARLTLALILHDRLEFDAAKTEALKAIAADPKNQEAHLLLGQILLAQGQWRTGLDYYEARNDMPTAMAIPAGLGSPVWNGMPLPAQPNSRIVVFCDQGYGDSIQFVRFAQRVARETGAEIHLAVSGELLPLLRRVDGVSGAFSGWAAAPPHVAHVRVSSLPRALGMTSEADIPRDPYLLADPAKVLQWRNKLPSDRRPLVGLAWRGRPTHPNDHRRSMHLADLRPLLRSCATFVSLQKPVLDEDRTLLDEFSMTDLSNDLKDYDDTAALVENLDLVVTADTSIAHLAGAMGKPVWIMIPSIPDFRWMLDREDSPWYPSARLFRQKDHLDWAPVVERIATELWAFVNRVQHGSLRLVKDAA